MNTALIRRFLLGGLALTAVVAGGAAPTRAQATPIVTALYDPTDGNITLSVTENGAAASLAVSAFQFLSPAQELSGSAAAIPPAAVSFFTVLNTDFSAIYEPPRQYAEIYANGLGNTLFTSSWNLGNVARTGLTQADLNAGFLSNGDVLAPAQAGKFLYESNATWFAGDLLTVPEPNCDVLFAAGVVLAAGGLTGRLRPGGTIAPQRVPRNRVAAAPTIGLAFPHPIGGPGTVGR